MFEITNPNSHKALSAGRLPEGTLGIPRPYRAKIAISTKLNFFPKKYSRKVTKIILNPRRLVLSAICLFQMYLIPDCYRTSNDSEKFSKIKFSKISTFRFQFCKLYLKKIFCQEFFLFFCKNFFHEISKNFFKFLVEISFIVLYNTNFY